MPNMPTTLPGLSATYAGTDSASTVDHADMHNDERGEINGIGGLVGVSGSAVATSHDYLIKVAADPGHSHTAASVSGVIESGDAAGGDLGGTYPNPTVTDDSHAHTGTTLSAIPETAITDGSLLARVASIETISAIWTFNAGKFYDKGSQVLDVRAYGTLTANSSAAAATNTATIAAAILAAASLDSKVVHIPAGIFYVTDVQVDQSVVVRGQGAELTILAYTSTTGYGVTMNNGYAEMENLRIYYAGTGAATAGGHMLWTNGRRLGNMAFETANTTDKAWRYINHQGAPSANWRWQSITFGNGTSGVAECGVNLDQLGSWPMPGDGMISDCEFLDTVHTVPALRIKGVPSMRLLNPKFLGWSVGVLIDWTPSTTPDGSGNNYSNGFYWVGGSCEDFTTAGLMVDRTGGVSATVYLKGNILSGVEFVPNSGTGATVVPCIDITDGSAPGWNITGCSMMQDTGSAQIGVRLGATSDNVSIVGNYIQGMSIGIQTIAGATDTYIGPNFLLDCTLETDIADPLASQKIFGPANVQSYLHVGSLAAPTNATDGYITATRLYSPKLVGSRTNASGGSLTLASTDHATKGPIIFGTSEYDEANNRLGIGMTPLKALDVTGDGGLTGYLRVGSATAPTNVTAGDVNSARLYVGADAAIATANTPIADIRGGGRFGAAGNDVLIGKAMATAGTPGVSMDYNVATASKASITALNPGTAWIPLVLAGSSIELSYSAQNTSRFTVAADVKLRPDIATPAGGSTSARMLIGTTAAFGIYYGSGAPTVSAAQGSIYIRSDGSSTSTRLYVNTDGGTTWTAFTSAA